MTKQNTATAGLPLFETATVAGMDVNAILAQAHVMRARAITGMLKSIFAPLKTVFRARRTARTLNGLSDSVLADIGLERAQIPSISRALADGTYVQPTAEVTVIEPLGEEKAGQDDHQPELPLAA